LRATDDLELSDRWAAGKAPGHRPALLWLRLRGVLLYRRSLIHDRSLRPNLRVARALAGWILTGELAAVGLGRNLGCLDYRCFRAALWDYHRDRAQDDRANPKPIWPKPGG